MNQISYISHRKRTKLPSNRSVILDIKNSLPALEWVQLQLMEQWSEMDEIICENITSSYISRSFRGTINSKDGAVLNEYFGSALYFQDHTGKPGWKLNKLMLSQNCIE